MKLLDAFVANYFKMKLLDAFVALYHKNFQNIRKGPKIQQNYFIKGPQNRLRPSFVGILLVFACLKFNSGNSRTLLTKLTIKIPKRVR